MAKYKVKHTSIMHNKKVYAEGSTIELTEEQAKRLEDFVDLIPETVKPKTQTQTQKNTKPKSETQTEKTATGDGSKTETSKIKADGEKDGGVDNDK